jgi:hypothetical protein
VTSATIVELTNQRGKSESPSTVSQPLRWSESGTIVGGNWLIWAFDMNELSTIHSSGSAKRIAIGASSRCQGLKGRRRLMPHAA